MNLETTPKPEFVTRAQSVQKLLASILGSTILAEWVSYFDWFSSIFKTAPAKLSDLRIDIAEFGLVITCLIGINTAVWLFARLIEFKKNYEELVEFKKEKKE